MIKTRNDIFRPFLEQLQHRIQPPSWPPLQSRIFGEGFLSLDGIGFVIPAVLELEGLEFEDLELEGLELVGLTGTLSREARACWLSRSASAFRSPGRPLTSKSENSRGSIEESNLVSGKGFDLRLQERRIKRKMVRSFLILHRTQKPPSASALSERPVNQGQSFANCP
jgi:hypothetical protein